MGEDAWYFGGDELLLVSNRDEIFGYDEMMAEYLRSHEEDDDEDE